jgi:hypothetical protein
MRGAASHALRIDDGPRDGAPFTQWAGPTSIVDANDGGDGMDGLALGSSVTRDLTGTVSAWLVALAGRTGGGRGGANTGSHERMALRCSNAISVNSAGRS